VKIGEWLKKNGKTQTWLAKRMKSDQGHVSEWVNGKVTPTLATITKFHQITKGEVSYPDFLKGRK